MNTHRIQIDDPHADSDVETQLAIADVAARLDPDKSRTAVARVMVALGSKFDWDSDTLGEVADSVSDVAAASGLPAIFNQDEDAIDFWERVQ